MGRAEARHLWESDDTGLWRQALDAYPAVVAAQGVKGLTELDRWYRDELPNQIAGRRPPRIEPVELVDAVRWKMLRGEWRPRNLGLVQGNPPELVREVTERAFAAVPDPRKPVAAIAELSGVGPATASAVLAAYRGDIYPFLDDLVGVVIAELGEPKFTLPYYLRYAEALRQRAARLGSPWTAQTVGFAFWSATGGKQR
jgi:hypothetical protein